MNRLLHLKAGTMFLLLFVFPLLLQIIAGIVFRDNDIKYLINSIINVMSTALFCTWLYAAGTKLTTLLPEGVRMDGKRVLVILALPVAYMGWSMINIFLQYVLDYSESFYAYIIWVQQVSIFILIPVSLGLLYGMFYTARLLKTVEYGRPVSGSDCIGDFLRLMFMPIGIWNIQPRLNDIAVMDQREEMDIFKQDPAY